MGEVYRARDERLGRDVALKLLPPEFARDTSRMDRFAAEARAAGSLNHPNIVDVHDLGSYQGSPYIVTELLEGKTLRERLQAGALPLRKALELAVQLASGLAAAHAKGIIHRDIKPENIFVMNDGRLKILDFGLAKVMRAPPAAASPDSPTVALDDDMGMMVGTAGYMSPEQVRGEPATALSDIFAFGCVFYEMLSGRRAFYRDSFIESLRAILKEEPPPLSESKHDFPAALDAIVRRCMEKVPRERFQSAIDVAFSIEAAKAGLIEEPRHQAPKKRFGGVATALVLGAAVLASAVVVWLLLRAATAPNMASVLFHQITFHRGTVYTARFTPEGDAVVYSAAWEGGPRALYEINLKTTDSRPLEIQNTDVAGISASQEMALILRPNAFGFSPGMLSRAPLSGGPGKEMLDDVSWADWRGDDKRFLVVREVNGKRRLECPVDKVLYEPAGYLNYPRLSPLGDKIAFLDHPSQSDDSGDVDMIDLAGRRSVLSRGWGSIEGVGWRPDGKEIWFAAARKGLAASIWAVDLSGKERLLVRAPGRLVLHDVSSNGDLVAERNTPRQSIVGKLAGDAEEHDLSWLDYSSIADISQDGRAILFTESGEGTEGTPRSYLRKAGETVPIRLGDGTAIALSPDGKWAMAVSAGSANDLVVYPTGPGESRSIAIPGVSEVLWAGWFPNGSDLLVLARSAGHDTRFYKMAMTGGPPRPFGPEGVYVRSNTISPDGKWVAAWKNGATLLVPTDGGEPKPLPGTGDGGLPVRWASDGASLFMKEGSQPPVSVFLFNLKTGKREPWRRFAPADGAGILGMGRMVIAPDGSAYAYTYFRLLSDLYLIEGVK